MIRLVAVLLFLPLVFIGQQDFGLWTKANFDYKFNKKFSLTSKTELRSEENARERSQFYSQLSGKYKLSKAVSFSLAYRLKSLKRVYGEELQQRWHTDLNVRLLKSEGLSVLFRTRTQLGFAFNGNSFSERLRLKVKYKFNKKLSYFIYDEIYIAINNNENYNRFNKIRFGTGIEYKLNKSISAQIKYLRISDINTPNPSTLNVLGLAVAHKLN